jgi:hypothetical protein
MIEAVKQAMVMSAVDEQDAASFLAKYQPAQVEEAIEYTREHASRPSWAYLKSVLKAKPRRLTMDDYATFSEITKAKLDRFVTGYEGIVWTGLEKDLLKLPPGARKAMEGGNNAR